MNLQVSTQPPKTGNKIFISPLEKGDHLTREEFHRRYEAMPENVKAELIGGVVYLSSPVRVRNHREPHSLIMSCLGLYSLSTKGVKLLDNTTFFVNEEDDLQKVLEDLQAGLQSEKHKEFIKQLSKE